jgi:hypothetical protein
MDDRPMSTEELAEALAARNLIRVSADTGVHLNTLYKYRTRSSAPRYDNLVRLSTYLRTTEAT